MTEIIEDKDQLEQHFDPPLQLPVVGRAVTYRF